MMLMLETSIRRLGGRLIPVVSMLVLAAPASGQVGPDPRGDAPNSPPKRLSELRRAPRETADEPSPSPAPGEPEARAEAKAEPESKAAGIFGDASKFTRFGGWGSFGSAIGEFGFAKAALIMMPPVQDELKLTDDQKRSLRELQDGMRKKGEALGKSMRARAGGNAEDDFARLPIASRVARITDAMGQFGDLARENDAGILRLLKPAQRKRLNQISLQMEGISALTRPEIIEALGMFEEDEQAIRQILARAQTMRMTTWIGSMMAMRAKLPARDPNAKGATIPRASDGKTAASDDPKPADPQPEDGDKARVEREKAARKQFESMRDRTDQIQAQALREVAKVLNKAQFAKWEILLGPPFDPKKINTLGPPNRPDKPRPE